MTGCRGGMMVAAVVVGLVWAAGARAQAAGAGQGETELAKQTQNPVADLISVPFQNNFNFGTGPRDRTVWVCNFQPVIPFHLLPGWLLVTRWIVPIVDQPALAPESRSAFGLGDINPSFFLAPLRSESFLWGVGTTFTAPTASSRELGAGKWSVGPTAVALTMQGPWVAGALVNNQWSVGGWGKAHVNQTYMQPFVNYNFGKGRYLVSAPILTANWEAPGGDVWTVPVGMGGGKVFRLRDLFGDGAGAVGEVPLNASVQAFWNAAKPDTGPDWQLRAALQFLFPK